VNSFNSTTLTDLIVMAIYVQFTMLCLYYTTMQMSNFSFAGKEQV